MKNTYFQLSNLIGQTVTAMVQLWNYTSNKKMGNCKECSWTIDHVLRIPHKHILGFMSKCGHQLSALTNSSHIGGGGLWTL